MPRLSATGSVTFSGVYEIQITNAGSNDATYQCSNAYSGTTDYIGSGKSIVIRDIKGINSVNVTISSATNVDVNITQASYPHNIYA